MIAIYFLADELPYKNKESKKDSADADGGALFLYRANRTLHDMQCMMDTNGATDLTIDLIMAEPSPNIFLECIQLAIALLEGGNEIVQVSPVLLYVFVFDISQIINFLSI